MADAPIYTPRWFVDSIDEALKRRQVPRTKRRYKRRQIGDVAMKQLKHAEKLQVLMGKQIARIAQDGDVDTGFVQAFNTLTSSITNAMEQIRRSHKAEIEAAGGLSDDQLDDVLRASLPRLAAKMDEYERHLMCEEWFGGEVAAILVPSGKAA